MAERSRRHRVLLTVAGWLTAAAMATAVTLAAVSSIGTSIFGSSAGPLDQAEIEQALASLPAAQTPSPEPGATTGTPPATSPGTSTSPSGTGPPRSPAATREVITSPGGNVLAQCVDGRVEIVSWSPAQGFHVDSVDEEPTRTAEIEFEAEDSEVEIAVRCTDGVPDATVEVDN